MLRYNVLLGVSCFSLIIGVLIQSSSFFNSNTVPLKISFLNSDPFGDNIDIIFKVNDIISYCTIRHHVYSEVSFFQKFYCI